MRIADFICAIPPLILSNRQQWTEEPRAGKTLDEMRANWRHWRIKASRRLATAHGVNVRKPGAGAASFFERPAVAEAVPISAGPPIKPVDVRRFVVFIGAARASNE